MEININGEHYTLTPGANGRNAQLGITHHGERDLYGVMGYKKTLRFQDYVNRYERQDIASRVVEAYPDASWVEMPELVDEATEDTQFEADWKELNKQMNLLDVFHRSDVQSGIGHYGVIVLGVNDGRELDQPVDAKKATGLVYTQVYREDHVEIESYYNDSQDRKYGQPMMYKVTIPNVSNLDLEKRIHADRIIHIAENASEVPYIGRPRLKNVFNRLQDIETVAASSAEAFWLTANPGLLFEADADVEVDDDSKDQVKAQISEYVNTQQRYLITQGLKGRPLEPAVSSPKDHIDSQIALVSSGTGIPQRILKGSEAAQLASGQDVSNWLSRVDERRKNHIEPNILRAFVDRLISFGVLTEPSSGNYTVVWSDIRAVGAAEKADIASKMSIAIGEYAVKGGDSVMPLAEYYTRILNIPQEEAEEIAALVESENEKRKQEELDKELLLNPPASETPEPPPVEAEPLGNSFIRWMKK